MVKKPFIERNEARVFQLLHRSQHDPLVVDPESSQRVLVEVNKNKAETQEPENTYPKKFEDAAASRVGQAALHGIYYDDTEYDYMKHLKVMSTEPGAVYTGPGSRAAPTESSRRTGFALKGDAPEAGPSEGLVLPEEALPSRVQMPVGILNQEAYPKGLLLEYDHEVREAIYALDDEQCTKADVDQDFFDMLNAEGDIEYERDEETHDADNEEQDFLWRVKQANQRRDNFGSDAGSVGSGGWNDDDGRRTTGTGFSMSSSAMFRNENLTLLDERFDQFEGIYASTDESDEDDDSEAMGQRNVRDDFEEILDQFLDKYEVAGRKMMVKVEGERGVDKWDTVRRTLVRTTLSDGEGGEVRDTTERDEIVNLVHYAGRSRRGETGYEVVHCVDHAKKYDNWDCESVLSTYSNLENHPSLIPEAPSRRIKINQRTGLPSSTPNHRAATQQDQDASDEDDEENQEPSVNLGAPRSKQETAEEKKQRKQATKELKKIRRQEKKATKDSYRQDRVNTQATRNPFAYQIPL
ncbi:Protein ltv1 [Tieghemiomyces parasiticus]|uniref:Protein ltv1 n=1 Tax=Tieghemiomyces parasiticus TaxID=78921 RepID=A0A9W8A507_9FUNG|nr:Protein ltv1 [Tieghemiomyces parasiticus]